MKEDQTQHLKKMSPMVIYSLGLSEDNFKTFSTIEELKKNPPNIIIAECVTSTKFVQNKFEKPQEIKKKNCYVMSAGVYGQLHCDTRIFNRKTGKPLDILKPSSMQFKKVYNPYCGQNLDNKTLLVTRQGGIGDLLFIQPNLIYLKEKYPTCTIKFACGPQYQSMIREWDCVDEILDLPFLVNEMFTFNSDYQLVFEGVIERCKEAEEICAYNLFSKWMGLDLPDELLVPTQKPNEETTIVVKEDYLKELGLQEKDFIVIQMRASSPIRTPSPGVWKKLINLLTDKGHNILLTDLPSHSQDIDNFIKTLQNKDKVFNFSKYSKEISHTISVVSLSKLVIATDSALPHIAESLGIKSFSIMGPFPGRVRYSTYKNNDWIDAVREGCSPCFIHGIKPCEHSFSGHSDCYKNLDYDLCIEKIERLLS